MEKKLYQDLMNLCNQSETFFFKDAYLDNIKYRIFNYRLSSWTEFMLENALNCRGTMFDITNEEQVKLVSLPPEKFFNYEEGNVDHISNKKIGDIMTKMDGSLISTYIHNGELQLKSKGSLLSVQAIDANKFLNKEENQLFKKDLIDIANKRFTINLEYTAPHNRIVVPYQEEKLTVLSIRSHVNGFNYFGTNIKKTFEKYQHMLNNMVFFENSTHLSTTDFVEFVRAQTEGEGNVVEIIPVNQTGSPYLMKVKNIKYIELHHTKESVNSNKRLFNTIIEEASDDLRSMFTDDPYVLNKITEMENKIIPLYNSIIQDVEQFYENNKSLSRKEYAILAQKEQKNYFGLTINLFLNKENNYKEFAKKNRVEIFGITDCDNNLEESDTVILNNKPKIH